MKLDLYRNVDAATVSQSEWLGQFWRVDFNMLDALWCGFIGVFIAPSPASSLNPVLWTIYYELVGSLIVYSLLALVGRDSRRIIMYIIMMIVLINTNYAGFITGVVLCDLYVNKNVIYKNISLFKRVYKFVLLVIAVILASYPAYISNASDFSLLYRIMSELPELNITKNIIYLVASMLFIVLILTSIKFQTLLEVKPIIFLGKISYSMYAVHLIILGVVASAVFVYFDSFMPYNYAVLSMMPIYLVSVFLTSTLLSIYVDKPSIYLSKLISNKLSLKR